MAKTPDEVGALELPRVLDLLEYWAEFPPTHLLLRNYVGYQPPDKPKTIESNEDLFELIKLVEGR